MDSLKNLQSNDPDAAALMSRLESQFGDMDLANLLMNENGACSDAESEESSLQEPTPEELQAWQEAQFKIGKKKLEQQTKNAMTPLQKRRQEKNESRIFYEEDEEDWEEVFAAPDLDGQTSVFFPSSSSDGVEFLGVHPLLQKLGSADPEILCTKWLNLFSSAEGDGLSFGKLLEALRGYAGPTIILIGTQPSATHSLHSKIEKKGGTIGMFTATSWSESKEMFGSSDCFLFSVVEEKDEVNILRPKNLKNGQKKESGYMYCHPSSHSSIGDATDGDLHGIGIGGTTSQPRLHLTESLEDCRALSYCGLFEDGDLLPGSGADSLYYFDVEYLEVWGVGGDEWITEALQQRQREREITSANLRRARSVDKKQLMDDFRSGLLGGKALFGHAEHVAGQVDLCVSASLSN